MTLKERAKRDIERITSNTDEWAQSAVLTATNGTTLTVALIHTKHHLGIDAELQKWANTKNAHISVSEQQLIDGSYPYTNPDGEVDLLNHKVAVADSAGVTITYKIEQWFPNKTIGLITCLLGDFE